MSRIGNKPITVPEGVEVKIDGHKITVKGPKGTLEREIHKNISLEMDANTIKVTRLNDEPANKSLHGLTRTLINNMIQGVVNEFKRELEDRKDNYIAEVMKGIRIYHERDFGSMGVNYKILFENVYRTEKVEEER